jgi:hypothetical protein
MQEPDEAETKQSPEETVLGVKLVTCGVQSGFCLPLGINFQAGEFQGCPGKASVWSQTEIPADKE